MKLVKRLGVILAGFVVTILVVGFLLPSKAHVERSLVIDASPDRIFSEVNNLKKWPTWSPWHKNDPNMKVTYSGPPEGVGASSSWESESEGNGAMTISESLPGKSLAIVLDFGDRGTATSFWKFSPEGEGSTRVTWGFDTDLGNNPAMRFFGLAMDSMVGAQYEAGLRNLKEICEKAAEEPEAVESPEDATAPAPPTENG